MLRRTTRAWGLLLVSYVPLAPEQHAEREGEAKEPLRERISKIKVLHNLHVFVGATRGSVSSPPKLVCSILRGFALAGRR